MSIDYRKISYFVTIARSGSFQKASKELLIAQPALSKSVKELEQCFGVRLLERSYRGVSLTPKGKKFFSKVGPLVEELSKIHSSFFDEDQVVDTITIGYFGPSPLEFLSKPISKFEKHELNIKIEFEKSGEAQVGDLLVKGFCDFALINEDFQEPGFERKFLGQHRLVAVLPKSHPICKKPALKMSDVWRETLIVPSRNRFPYLRKKIDGLTSQKNQRRIVEIESENLTEIIFQCTLLNAFALLPEPLSRIKNRNVRFVEIDSEYDLNLKIFLAWNPLRLNQPLKLLLETF